MAKKPKAVPSKFRLDETAYTKRARRNDKCPWGYEEDPESRDYWLPIPEQIDALKLAFKYLKTSTYPDVVRWLVDVTKRPTTVQTLRYIVEQERKKQLRFEGLRSKATRARGFPEGYTGDELTLIEEEARQAEEDCTNYPFVGEGEQPEVKGLNASRGKRIRNAVISLPKPVRAERKAAAVAHRYRTEGIGADPWFWDDWPSECYPGA